MIDERKEIEMPPLPAEEQPVVEETPAAEPEVAVETPAAEAEATGLETNMKNLRLAREKAERERDDLLVRMREIEQAQQKPEPPKAEENLHVAADDFVEGRHLAAYEKKIQALENRLKQNEQKNTASNAETRLKSQYQDFDKVVNAGNIEALRLAYPEIAQTINSTDDLYTKAVSAYTLIKKLGIHKEDTFAADRAKAQTNAAKPRPLTSVKPQEGEGPLSKANAFAQGLTEDLKKQLYKEMMEARR